MTKEKLRVKNITVNFEEKSIIEDVTITLNEGEIVSILGVSGVGKTTLFNVIAGLINPCIGTVELDGENIIGKSGKISYMLQKDLLFPFKTILDNVSLPLILKGENKKKAREIAGKYFSQFGLEGMENKYPKELSGGMRQRAAFLRTYMFSSEIALLDEPFSALDTITKQKIHTWYLDVVKKLNISILFITHDIDEAILISDRIYIISGKPGKIVNEIEVKINKNISNEEVSMTQDFLNYKKEIMKFL
ncbi:MAG: ABC transporter ATP-binding protein [Leptotrichiaceae bacterium]|nr:ABC transporter ATP-binding protein [Leptotrichiaceae bacterium]MBP6281582.1 ABC transporter ATP-binding protein [Leptotrichiaceae bacterium]MBP7100744.1 ABC transporter ATP-binding protein [Leptotrichiaceae bacterium]MBP7725190.1 ABC transporter ATP-binding protein [Leptotrichiaceae bacterium]